MLPWLKRDGSEKLEKERKKKKREEDITLGPPPSLSQSISYCK
jgi:hypothetical protein